MRIVSYTILLGSLLASRFAIANEPIKAVGKWVEAADGKNGTQRWTASDLTYDRFNDCLWSIPTTTEGRLITDESGATSWSVSVYRIDIATNLSKRTAVTPVKILFSTSEMQILKGVLSLDGQDIGLDFRAFTASPQKNIFYACTGGANPLLLRLSLKDDDHMNVVHAARISALDSTDRTVTDTNGSGWTGLTTDEKGDRLFLALDQICGDDCPRLFTIELSDFNGVRSLVNDPDSSVVPTSLEHVRLPVGRISSLQHVAHPRDQNHPGFLLVLDQNHPQVFIIDLPFRYREPRAVKLDLIAPSDKVANPGIELNGIFPAGLAVRNSTGPDTTIWVINDPLFSNPDEGSQLYFPKSVSSDEDEISSFKKDHPILSRNLELEIPLLFEFPLKDFIQP